MQQVVKLNLVFIVKFPVNVVVVSVATSLMNKDEYTNVASSSTTELINPPSYHGGRTAVDGLSVAQSCVRAWPERRRWWQVAAGSDTTSALLVVADLASLLTAAISGVSDAAATSPHHRTLDAYVRTGDDVETCYWR